MKYSIIIPSLNSTIIDKILNELIKQIRINDIFDAEVIVVGKDEENRIPKSLPVIFEETERVFSPAEARNFGAKLSKSEVLIFLDSDCIPSANWLRIIDNTLSTKEIDFMGGGVEIPHDNYWMLADNLSMFHESLKTQSGKLRIFFASLNFAIYRTVFLNVGSFNEAYPIPAGEDSELSIRLARSGYKGWFEPKAWVIHTPPRNSLKSLLRHGFFQGKYSTKIRMPHQPGSFPKWLRHPFSLVALCPFLAMFATLRVFKNPKTWKYFYTLPAVILSKIAWCVGAASRPSWKFDR